MFIMHWLGLVHVDLPGLLMGKTEWILRTDFRTRVRESIPIQVMTRERPPPALRIGKCV